MHESHALGVKQTFHMEMPELLIQLSRTLPIYLENLRNYFAITLLLINNTSRITKLLLDFEILFTIRDK